MRPDEPLIARLTAPFEEGAPAFRDVWTSVNMAPHPTRPCIVDQSFATPHCCDYVFATDDVARRVRTIVCDEDTRVPITSRCS